MLEKSMVSLNKIMTFTSTYTANTFKDYMYLALLVTLPAAGGSGDPLAFYALDAHMRSISARQRKNKSYKKYNDVRADRCIL